VYTQPIIIHNNDDDNNNVGKTKIFRKLRMDPDYFDSSSQKPGAKA